MAGRQGVSRKNIPSVETCRKNGWSVGQYLVAPGWKTPREIKEIRDLDVVLDNHSQNRVKSFHADVRLATNQEAARWQTERKRLLKERDRRARNAKKKKVFVVRVVEFRTGECVREVECGESERKADKVELGMLRNMDLDRFGTEIVEREAS